MPLSVLIASLFARHKLLVLDRDPDADAALRTGIVRNSTAPPPTRPTGVLVLACLVLEHVSAALQLAHSRGANQKAYMQSDLRIGNVVMGMWQEGTWVPQPAVVTELVDEESVPQFNTAMLVDWGNAMEIGKATTLLPGNFPYSADAVLNLGLSKATVSRTVWTPLAEYEWESLAYLYWSITSPVLAQCPWLHSIGNSSLVEHRNSLLKEGGALERTVEQMITHARAGGTGKIYIFLFSCYFFITFNI